MLPFTLTCHLYAIFAHNLDGFFFVFGRAAHLRCCFRCCSDVDSSPVVKSLCHIIAYDVALLQMTSVEFCRLASWSEQLLIEVVSYNSNRWLWLNFSQHQACPLVFILAVFPDFFCLCRLPVVVDYPVIALAALYFFLDCCCMLLSAGLLCPRWYVTGCLTQPVLGIRVFSPFYSSKLLLSCGLFRDRAYCTSMGSFEPSPSQPSSKTSHEKRTL